LTVGAGGKFIFDPAQAASSVTILPGTVAVPEPGTLPLLIAGMALLVMCCRRR